jgi:conjugal transfer ATP-binding protein TraC
VVDPFRRLLYSTRPNEVAAIRKLRQEGHSVRDAINQLLGHQADG